MLGFGLGLGLGFALGFTVVDELLRSKSLDRDSYNSGGARFRVRVSLRVALGFAVDVARPELVQLRWGHRVWLGFYLGCALGFTTGNELLRSKSLGRDTYTLGFRLCSTNTRTTQVGLGVGARVWVRVSLGVRMNLV